jgi:uncharacterized repeat protein (TIGR03803 family)
MHSSRTYKTRKGKVDSSKAGPRFGSTKLATVIIRSALTLAVIAVLVVMGARPAQSQSGPYGVVSPTTLNFRGAVGQTSPPQLVSLKNTGDSELTVSNISISADFAIPTNHCANGVKPGTHCNVYVTFTASSPGTETGTLTFVDNASNSPQTVALTGTIGEIVLYDFTGGSDGRYPDSSLTFDGAGNLYGTTQSGGVFGYGTVYELSPTGSGGWNETVLYSFTGGADGAYATSKPIFDGVGNLYGTATGGGANGDGVVFELSPVGGNWTETVLYSFAGGADGANPGTGVIMDPTGNLYGTNSAGVFELSPSRGGWTNLVIYGVSPEGGLAMDAAGNIFGAGWIYGWSVFELSPNGNDGWNPTILHIFSGAGHDGLEAFGTPAFDQAGNVYGTTAFGGAKNYGTVYKLHRITKGKNKGAWTETILHSFESGRDGALPVAGVVRDAAGNIYGTTNEGGQYQQDLGGDGTVYELVAPVGKGSYKEKVLWSFNGTDGVYPADSLILDSAGNLYGTTFYRGGGVGDVFEVTP